MVRAAVVVVLEGVGVGGHQTSRCVWRLMSRPECGGRCDFRPAEQAISAMRACRTVAVVLQLLAVAAALVPHRRLAVALA